MTPSLNLASRPFRNERLATILVALATLALLAGTAKHLMVVRELLPARATQRHRAVADLEEDLRRLRQEREEFQVPEPDREDLERWRIASDLVRRRTLSWTRLLGVLEDALHPDVRLVSISPNVTDEAFELRVTAIARSDEVALDFVRLLEQRPEFGRVYPESIAETNAGTELRYTLTYRPEAALTLGSAAEEDEEA